MVNNKNSTAFSMVLLATLTFPVFAGVEKVSVKVKGLACPFCAYNIEKRLKTLDGVDKKSKINVVVKEGITHFKWKSDEVFSPSAVREQIRKAGFTPDTIDIEVTGEVRTIVPKADKKPLLQLTLSTTKRLQIIGGDRADQAESYDLLAKTTLISDKSQGENKREPFSVRINGRITGDADWKLQLLRWEPVHYKSRVEIKVKKLACEQCSLSAMRTLKPLSDVIHVEADHLSDRVTVWSKAKSPGAAAIQKALEESGRQVKSIEVVVPKTGDLNKSEKQAKDSK